MFGTYGKGHKSGGADVAAPIIVTFFITLQIKS